MFFHEGEGQKHEYENYEIAHFRLLSDTNFLPYGKSMIEAARKIWKQLMLMEDAMLLHRIMRAPEKRVFKIDIGNIPPAEVDTYMNSLISKMKKTPFIDQATGDYNLKYNMQNMFIHIKHCIIASRLILFGRTSNSGGPRIRFVSNWFSEVFQFGFDCKATNIKLG